MSAVNNSFTGNPDTLTVSFGKQAKASRAQFTDLADRDLFYYLLHVDEFPAVMAAAQQRVEQSLAQAREWSEGADQMPPNLCFFPYTPAAFAQRMHSLYQEQRLADYPPAEAVSREQLDYVLKQYAPSALLDGCWLQGTSIAPTNHHEVYAQLFGIYADKIGDGDTGRHAGNCFRTLLTKAGINLPDLNSRLFTVSAGINDAAFNMPVLELALSLFPRVYLPELLGYTLSHYFCAPDRLLYGLRPALRQAGLDDGYPERHALGAQPGLLAMRAHKAVELYLEACTDEITRQTQWWRIWTGLLMHQQVARDWQADLRDALHHPRQLTPHQKMLALMAAKVPHARNMHRNRKVGGQLINDWFAQDPFDAEAFLKALAASPYVNRKDPAKSALLTRSVNFGGPMFRIFTDAEQAVMAEWVHSLAQQQADTATAPLPQPQSPVPPRQAPVIDRATDKAADLATYARCSKRELYYYFVNADLYPDILPTARKVATGFFRQARRNMGKRNLDKQLRFFPYDHTAFEQRIRDIYTTELDAYEAFVPPSTVPREIMVWFAWQYAPFPMVDGSWVQHIARAGMSHTEISARLFRIYSDEVGNGDTTLNHPTVYRKMLEAEGIDMPPTDSLAFAMQSVIRDFAFDLPLLTLSVSMFPRAFLPEIIGVNLAIELSGLGKGYMQIIDELKFWKIDPYFFTLHLTIDNIASGHTAVAMETVHLYLDQVLATHGEQAMQREWERIWVGYLAFRQNMTRFDATLERQAALRYLIPLIRQNLKRLREKKPVPRAA